MGFYNEVKKRFNDLIIKNNIDINVDLVATFKLKAAEAIGTPSRKDYPILKGREHLINAEFKGFIGQAYTDQPSSFKGNLKDVLELDLNTNSNKAIFVATINAVLKSLGLIDKTVHCKDDEPKECAKSFIKFLKDAHKKEKIALIGLQPAILHELSKKFKLRVLDLDEDNIGKEKSTVIIEHGINDYEDVINWADVILVTGSTCCNGTVVNFIDMNKQVYFYGTSIAGIAYLMNLNRLCFCAK